MFNWTKVNFSSFLEFVSVFGILFQALVNSASKRLSFYRVLVWQFF